MQPSTCTKVSKCRKLRQDKSPSWRRCPPDEQGVDLSQRDQDAELRHYYRVLFQAWGRQHWWPAESRLEVVLGAYLTQNTSWTNVERALSNLRAANALDLNRLRKMRLSRLERLIQPSGYFRQKAKRIKTFIAFLDRMHGGSLDRLFSQPTAVLREQLLGLNGVGPETADSILLYSANHPVFVVDAYTRRILERHAIIPEKASYEEIRALFERALARLAKNQAENSSDSQSQTAAAFRGAAHPPSAMSTAGRTPLAQVYNEMHGLIVGVGKHFCRKSEPRCDECPLQRFLPGR